MQTRTLIPASHSKSRRKVARYSRPFSAFRFIPVWLILTAASLQAQLNHPPQVSDIPDQLITGGNFAVQYFKVFDHENTTSTVSSKSTNPSFLPDGSVLVTKCQPGDPDYTTCVNGGNNYRVTFTAPQNAGATTITIKAKEPGPTGPAGYTSFTLQLDNPLLNINPPVIATLPNAFLRGSDTTGAVYKSMFVIGDLDEDGFEDINSESFGEDSFISKTSSNHTVLADEMIDVFLMPGDSDPEYVTAEGPRSYLLQATTVPGQTGEATVTIKLEDPNSNTITKSCTIVVVDPENAPPSISNKDGITFEELLLPDTHKTHAFTVAGASSKTDLKVTAKSSNTLLVPNDLVNNLKITQPGSNGEGSIDIHPMLPLPSPSPGRPQAATITLSVQDDAYIQQNTFLFIVAPALDSGGVANAFSRPSGVYLLNPKTVHRLGDDFLTGEMHGREISWAALESAPIGDVDQFNFDILDALFLVLPPDQVLSINLQEEPCYIADTDFCSTCLEFPTWCDTNDGSAQMADCGTVTPCPGGVLRAVPWDSYLRERRRNFIAALAAHLEPYMGRISFINPNLPGGETGIRDTSLPFDQMPGYTRERLLGAVQDELRTIQDYFPGKPVQIGLFKATDMDNNSPLWAWLYRDASNSTDDNGVHLVSLFDEFNGIRRPRVNFFQEDLAATRVSAAPNYFTPPLSKAYTLFPDPSFLPSFDYYPDPPSEDDLNDEYNNGYVFQANTPWVDPFTSMDGAKLIKTINGSPNDGLEAAFNTYLSQYLEVYLGDIDQAQPPTFGVEPTLDAVLWAGELKSWKDYTDTLQSRAPREAPAGLSVVRNLDNSNTVSWYAVYAPVDANPVKYYVDRKNTTGSGWTNVCFGITGTLCQDTSTSTGSAYAYRVRASKGANTTPYAYVAGFLSEGGNNNDGYVKITGQTFPHATQPGILAGQDTAGNEVRGILSYFNGSISMGTVLTAKLRLDQANATGAAFDALGPCFVDVKTGFFGSSAALDSMDFGDNTNVGAKVAQIIPFIPPPDGVPAWVEAYLDATGVSKVNTSSNGRTQFRVYFNDVPITNTFGMWYSGEANAAPYSVPPQLIVQYTP